jgi:hypothetical protein
MNLLSGLLRCGIAAKSRADPFHCCLDTLQDNAWGYQSARFGALFKVGRINVSDGGVGLSMAYSCVVCKACGKPQRDDKLSAHFSLHSLTISL